MEDPGQGKRLFATVVICIAIAVGGSFLFSKPPAKQPPAATAPAATTAPATAATPAAAAPAGTPAAPTPVTRGPEKHVKVGGDGFDSTLSSWGGALSSLKLSGTQYTAKQPDGKRGPMDLVRADGAERYPLQVELLDSTHTIPAGAEWVMTTGEAGEVIATWSSPELEVVKRYRVVPEHYSMELDIAVTNKSAIQAKERLAIHVYGYEDPAKEGGGGFLSYNPPRWMSSCHVAGETRNESAKSVAKAPRELMGAVRWVGINHKYFLLAIAPQPGADQSSTCRLSAVEGKPGVMKASLILPQWELAPGDTAVRKLLLFGGPKDLDELEAVAPRLGGDNDLDRSVDWGTAPLKWFTVIARPMLSLLKVYYSWVLNWGLAIIMLTFTVKLLTIYWTHKSMKSMRAMGKMKPYIDALKEKYPDDRQRQQVEMMNLYKQHQINPLGGCLPMLLQMPIWMALYSSLQAAAELYQAKFLWMNDLTAPDPYYIIPVVLTGLMFLGTRLTPTAADPQQRIVQYMVPVMIGVFSLVFPSGLNVYILTNQVLSMAHQIYMNRTDPITVPPVATPAMAPPARREDLGGEPMIPAAAGADPARRKKKKKR